MAPNDAWEKAKGRYGRVQDAVKILDPRTDKEVALKDVLKKDDALLK